MEKNKGKLLVIGIGNSSRRDDGLGWKFLECLPADDRVHIEYRFQLQVEDADFISEYETIVFVDATHHHLTEGFAFAPCDPLSSASSFSTHRVEPSAVLWLCRELYGHVPQAYVLAIEGVSWGLQDGLSPEAESNLARGLSFFEEWQHWYFSEEGRYWEKSLA